MEWPSWCSSPAHPTPVRTMHQGVAALVWEAKGASRLVGSWLQVPDLEFQKPAYPHRLGRNLVSRCRQHHCHLCPLHRR